jgi:thioredoxin-related protein
VAGPIPFDAQDVALEQALAAARSAGKPAALYILSPTCGYCTKLLSGTLTNAGVQAEMRSYYNVRYTSTTPAGSAASRQYVRGGYPTTVVVDGSGRVMKEIVGYEDPARYAGNLRAAGR